MFYLTHVNDSGARGGYQDCRHDGEAVSGMGFEEGCFSRRMATSKASAMTMNTA